MHRFVYRLCSLLILLGTKSGSVDVDLDMSFCGSLRYIVCQQYKSLTAFLFDILVWEHGFFFFYPFLKIFAERHVLSLALTSYHIYVGLFFTGEGCKFVN